MGTLDPGPVGSLSVGSSCFRTSEAVETSLSSSEYYPDRSGGDGLRACGNKGSFVGDPCNKHYGHSAFGSVLGPHSKNYHLE